MKHCDHVTCKHTAVKFCEECRTIYCVKCKRQWYDECTQTHYPYVYTYNTESNEYAPLSKGTGIPLPEDLSYKITCENHN